MRFRVCEASRMGLSRETRPIEWHQLGVIQVIDIYHYQLRDIVLAPTFQVSYGLLD